MYRGLGTIGIHKANIIDHVHPTSLHVQYNPKYSKNTKIRTREWSVFELTFGAVINLYVVCLVLFNADATALKHGKVPRRRNKHTYSAICVHLGFHKT